MPEMLGHRNLSSADFLRMTAMEIATTTTANGISNVDVSLKGHPRPESFFLAILTCWIARAHWDITDESKECARGPGQIPVLAIEKVNRNGCLQM
jgi:hypothetical protein